MSPRPTPQLQQHYSDAESLVAALMAKQGWQILARNYRKVGCELDIVAAKGQTLAIVEVKLRRYDQVRVEMLLPRRKRQSLVRGARYFVTARGGELRTACVRFDLALVQPNADNQNKKTQIHYWPGVFDETDL